MITPEFPIVVGRWRLETVPATPRPPACLRHVIICDTRLHSLKPCAIPQVKEEGTMQYGTVQFPGDTGKHHNPDGRDCAGRQFAARVLGTGAAYTNTVECLACHGQFEAYEHRLASGIPVHPIP
jgi:hypothetical protein